MTETQVNRRRGWVKRVSARIAIITGIVAGIAAITGQLTTIWNGISWLLPGSPPQISIVRMQYVHFRPRAKPPEDPSAANADVSWTRSPLTIVAPLSYLDQSSADVRAVVTSSNISLTLGTKQTAYDSTYVTHLVSDKPCKEWLCDLKTDTPENLKSGRATSLKEKVFLPLSDNPLEWRDFVDGVTSPDGVKSLRVVISAKVELPDAPPLMISAECIVDIARYRPEFDKYFVPGKDPRPVFWQPACN